jgi:hypothetical protein
VANLFPLRTSSPDALLSHADPLGPRSLANCAILEAVDRASMVICAWGSHEVAASRAFEKERERLRALSGGRQQTPPMARGAAPGKAPPRVFTAYPRAYPNFTQRPLSFARCSFQTFGALSKLDGDLP